MKKKRGKKSNRGRKGRSARSAMKKKSDMESECAALLKPFGKTIKDATDSYLRQLNRKKSTGRPRRSGPFSGIPPHMNWRDVETRLSELSYRPAFSKQVVYLLEMMMGNTWRLAYYYRTELAKLAPAQRAKFQALKDYCDAAIGMPLGQPAGSFTNVMTKHIWTGVVEMTLEEVETHSPKTRSPIEQQIATAEQQFSTAERFVFCKGRHSKRARQLKN